MSSKIVAVVESSEILSARQYEIGDRVYKITRGTSDFRLLNWQDSCPEFCEPHFVQRITAQRVYAEALWIFDERPYILSRDDLERKGYTFGRNYTLFFVAMPEAYRKLTIGYTTSEPARLVLGLPEIFSSEELTKAYRRKAMEAHPDRGGTHEKFLAVQAAYDQLKR